MEHSNSDTLVAVGRVVKARGIRGELKVKLLSDFPERFKEPECVKLEFKNGEIKSFEIEKTRIAGNFVIVKLKGIESRDAAETLQGLYLSVSRDETIPLEENSFYIFELEGMEVFESDGRRIGSVIRVEQYPSNDVLVVGAETEDLMIPAVKEFVKRIDADKRQIIVGLLEGLPSYPKGSG